MSEVTITLERAKALEVLVDATARLLNQHIAQAALSGLIVEAEVIQFDQLGRPGPTPLLKVTVKVRPDQLVVGPEVQS
jgi:hypothetical protein